MNNEVFMEVGVSYRLKLDQEIRDENTGTIRELVRKGSVVIVKRIAAEENRVWLEGHPHPLNYAALRRRVVKA